jgi:tRNA nucleotidyltransferase (CCA-adding enzyme)
LIQKENIAHRLHPCVPELASAVRRSGGRALVVGGFVRDALLGRKSSDCDVECFGIDGENLLRVLGEKFELDLGGASFGVIKL